MTKEYILEMSNISKSFPGVKALDNVQLKIRKGTVHALMGENGAGKSTLMKILAGIYQPDDGTIIFKGNQIEVKNPHDALKYGISMIHQELSPIPHMTVAENIFLGREPLIGKTGLVDKKKMVEDAKELLEKLEMHDINPTALMHQLSIAKTQQVEIAKAISYDSDLIIMDEPTSAITEVEVEHLFKIVRNLRDKGVAIIFITHKMDEVFKIVDEITVFRDGQYIGTELAENLNKEKLIEMMVGREITQMFPKEPAEIGEVILSVKNLTKSGLFENVSFDLRKGEILGFAGLMGAGRTEVMESIFGIRKADQGEVYIKGEKVEINTPRDAIKRKMAFLTEDRKLTGVFLPLAVRDNIVVSCIDKFINGLFLNKKKIEEVCQQEKDKLAIKTPNMDQKIKNLSGGNQQKVLISRWLLTDPDILILDEPTRGIDVGAKSEIHRLMSKLAQQGKAVIMISSELPEILGMSDRILVMHEGKITGELDRFEATQEKVLEYATGVAVN
ncbi:sugar ABC transporter ATP-binding protein [Petroclostridium xylanilyticum]|uniref:sugar ABC transporter ATP-binding protein n=2 Tax=Petroclostridium xylanilyticum TaxID=1792311 RepID=UPI000B98FAEF|nr:sugar ABC transporter ATP-binding protein [Petroclostridium xylanilyticum]